MNRYTHKTQADRYKNAQPLMVPFYAEEQSSEAKLYNPQTPTITKSSIEVRAPAENQHQVAASSRRITA